MVVVDCWFGRDVRGVDHVFGLCGVSDVQSALCKFYDKGDARL